MNSTQYSDDTVLALMLLSDIEITLANYACINCVDVDEIEPEMKASLPLCLQELTPESEALVQDMMEATGWNRYEVVETISTWRELKQL